MKQTKSALRSRSILLAFTQIGTALSVLTGLSWLNPEVIAAALGTNLEQLFSSVLLLFGMGQLLFRSVAKKKVKWF